MSRPRRGTEAVFYDTFADWSVEDQAAALRVLEALHRQKQRENGRRAVRAADERLPDPHMVERRGADGLFPTDRAAEVPGGPGPEDQER